MTRTLLAVGKHEAEDRATMVRLRADMDTALARIKALEQRLQ